MCSFICMVIQFRYLYLCAMLIYSYLHIFSKLRDNTHSWHWSAMSILYFPTFMLIVSSILPAVIMHQPWHHKTVCNRQFWGLPVCLVALGTETTHTVTFAKNMSLMVVYVTITNAWKNSYTDGCSGSTSCWIRPKIWQLKGMEKPPIRCAPL
mgnify:CR=1 FL=1